MNKNNEQTFKALREELGITQQVAANIIGLSLQAVQQIERREKEPVNTGRFSRSNHRNYSLLLERFQASS